MMTDEQQCQDPWHDQSDDGIEVCPSCGYTEGDHCQHRQWRYDDDDWDIDDDYCTHCECCCTCLGCEYGPRNEIPAGTL